MAGTASMAALSASMFRDPSEIGPDLIERRNQWLSAADAAVEAGWHDRALDLYLRILFRDVQGRYGPLRDDHFEVIGYGFDQRLAFAWPGILLRVARCANTLGSSPEEVRQRFIDLATYEAAQLAHLQPPVSPESAWSMVEQPLLKRIVDRAGSGRVWMKLR
jgi:hypothetical protein